MIPRPITQAHKPVADVLSDDVIACAHLLERGDPERFRAVMATPVEIRKTLFPVFAFNLEVARTPWVTKEPLIAEMRLQWWQDVLSEISDGRAVRRHEVAAPLATSLTPAAAEALKAVVKARRHDIYPEPFETKSDFQAYIHATSQLPDDPKHEMTSVYSKHQHRKFYHYP